ncbi:MAG: hypothetical protein IV100_13425 [Myxococcales bacterium]|nr:hypothetical protein [Myxococcales bacterium]
MALALAAGLDAITRGRRWPRIALGGAWLVGALVQTATIVHGAQRPAQWDAVGRIQAERAPGDAYCALPAVYFAQMTNYVLWNRHPVDLLGMPRWEAHSEVPEGLYGPIHPVNTTLETVVQNLAFERVWVLAYAEEAFGTPEFDVATTDHHLAWMTEHLIPDGEWRYPFLQLYRFRVPTAPERLWQKDPKGGWTASLDFSKTLHNFRYFPKFLHSQETGLSMRRPEVVVRVPAPPGAPAIERLTVEVEMAFGQPAIADDLALAGATPDAWTATGFRTTQDGGVWSGTLPVGAADRLDLSLKRSERATAAHRNSIIRMQTRGTSAAP